jgi:DeoR/GlpR family transcriptional regulator of sugar metabolism
MTDSKLKIDIRRQKILEILQQEGKLSVAELSRTMNTTPVTIRSDLTALEQAGHLIRVQGGAVPAIKKRNAAAGAAANAQEKKQIAQRLAEMVKDGDTLFINSGTTTDFVASALEARSNLNIVTNSLSVATLLGEIPSFRVILLGGEINAQHGFTYGSDALSQLEKYKADWAILSIDGISTTCGITTHHAEEAVIDRMMIANAKQTWIVADHTKVGNAGFARVRDSLKDIGVVTVLSAAKQMQPLQEKGIMVVYA